MLLFLRSVGLANAAVWLGAVITYVCVIAPAFFSETMRSLLPPAYAGAAELIVRDRYFVLLYWCGGIALGHLIAEWLYTGKSLRRWSTYLVAALIGFALLGGEVLQPTLQKLHWERHGERSTQRQRERAGSSFRGWQFAAATVNILTVLGVAVYAWQVAAAGTASRFVSAAKFRGLTNPV